MSQRVPAYCFLFLAVFGFWGWHLIGFIGFFHSYYQGVLFVAFHLKCLDRISFPSHGSERANGTTANLQSETSSEKHTEVPTPYWI